MDETQNEITAADACRRGHTGKLHQMNMKVGRDFHIAIYYFRLIQSIPPTMSEANIKRG